VVEPECAARELQRRLHTDNGISVFAIIHALTVHMRIPASGNAACRIVFNEMAGHEKPDWYLERTFCSNSTNTRP